MYKISASLKKPVPEFELRAGQDFLVNGSFSRSVLFQIFKKKFCWIFKRLQRTGIYCI